MAEPTSETTQQVVALPRRPRGRRMAMLTLVMAAGYVAATDFALHGGERWHVPTWDGVLTINSARVFLSALSPGQSANPNPRPAPLPFLNPLTGRGPTAEQRQTQMHLRRELAAVETVGYVWQRAMWGLASLLVLVAILSWFTPWGRLWHLLAAPAILLVAAMTLIGVRYLAISDGSGESIWPLSADRYHAWLERVADWARSRGQEIDSVPTGGGMGQPPAGANVFVAALSAYGWLLLVVFARRRKIRSSAELPTPSA